jgi:hypothetical protein
LVLLEGMKLTASTIFPPCKRCGAQPEEVNIPNDIHVAWVPFTGGKREILIRDWSATELICTECVRENEHQRYDDIYNAGAERGYKEAMKERY